jgi:hypothetical protein
VRAPWEVSSIAEESGTRDLVCVSISSNRIIGALRAGGEILVDDIEHLSSRQRGVVTTKDLCDRELRKPLHRLPINLHVRSWEVVDDDAVIDGVSRKERAARRSQSAMLPGE